MTKHWLLPRVKELRRRNSRIYLEIVSTVNQQSVATSDLDYVIRMGDPGENDLIGKRVADVPMGIFASEQYLAGRPAPRSLPELKDHDIIGHTTDFVSFRNIRPSQRHLLEYFSEAAGIADVAVIGVPDGRWGEAVKALIVLKPDRPADPAGILHFARERLAGFKIPKSIEFVTELPRNPSGKILKRLLRERYWKGYERRVN